MFTNHYKILCIDRNADTNTIKKAYRKLALKFHPDICKLKDAQIRFIEIQEAYEILGDISKRYYYNILYDYYCKTSNKINTENTYEAKIQKDYQQWKYQANKNAVHLSKENFMNFKRKVFESIGQVAESTMNTLQIIFNVSIIIFIFIAIFINWNDYKNGNHDSIYGVIICSMLAVIIIVVGVFYLRKRKY